MKKTIDEQRANDLFRWLGDFGPRFWLAANRNADQIARGSQSRRVSALLLRDERTTVDPGTS